MASHRFSKFAELWLLYCGNSNPLIGFGLLHTVHDPSPAWVLSLRALMCCFKMIVLLLLVRFLPSTVNQLMVHRDLGKGGQPETEELVVFLHVSPYKFKNKVLFPGSNAPCNKWYLPLSSESQCHVGVRLGGTPGVHLVFNISCLRSFLVCRKQEFDSCVYYRGLNQFIVKYRYLILYHWFW